MKEPLRHAYGLTQAKIGHSAQTVGMPTAPANLYFRELLLCVTLWIAALSQGSVGKILTHRRPLSCDVSSGMIGPGGRGQMLKRVLRRAPIVFSSHAQK